MGFSDPREFRLVRQVGHLKIALAACAAVIIFFLATKNNARCMFFDCIVVLGGKMTRNQAYDAINACDKFTYRNAGAHAIKMSGAQINDLYEKHGTGHPVVQAWYALPDIEKTPLPFERDLEKVNYQEIERACGLLRQSVYAN